jgi:TDG/mug DNA glycosylase family protein
MTQCQGFDPIADARARVLILGTLPSVQSLQFRQYYGNPANQFWRIMGDLFGAMPQLAYHDRVAILTANHIAMWDVCRSATRAGSLDAKIQASTVVLNDFATFLRGHPHIALIAFNGRPAQTIFRRNLPTLPDTVPPITFEVLPSTSPAHTIRYEDKLSRWRNCLRPFLNLG